MADLHSLPDDVFSSASTIRIEDLLGPTDVQEPVKPREGLPASFRMRADKHYVEMLDAPPPAVGLERIAVDAIEQRAEDAGAAVPALVESIARHGVLQPLLVQARNGRFRLIAGRKRLAAAVAAGLRDVPCIVRHADDEAAAAMAGASNVFVPEGIAAVRDAPADISTAASELARSLSALGACANLLANPVAALTRAVAADLLRAEVWRSACLLQAWRVLASDEPVSLRPVQAGTVVERVLQAIEPERRLRGITCDQQVDRVQTILHADEELLVCAFSGLLMETFALLSQHAGDPLVLTVAASPGGDFTLTIAHAGISAPTAWQEQRGPAERPIAIVAAWRIVEACNGRITVNAAARGAEIRVTLPTGT